MADWTKKFDILFVKGKLTPWVTTEGKNIEVSVEALKDFISKVLSEEQDRGYKIGWKYGKKQLLEEIGEALVKDEDDTKSVIRTLKKLKELEKELN